MKYTAYIMVLACLIRLITNMVWVYFDNPDIYYVGQSLFECLILGLLVSITENWLKTALLFFLGCAIFALIKQFINPTVYDPAEYIGAAVGVLFIIVEKVFIWLRKIWKKK